MRVDGRKPDELREVSIIPHFSRYAEGSVLISCGNTQVLCNVTVEVGVPKWIQEKGDNSGWVTAEYAMLPRATEKRNTREVSGLRGRTQEIKRLIGRSLRQSLDLQLLGLRTCIVDCDVLQADGGTRTLSITGGYVALAIALKKMIRQGIIPAEALIGNVAAVAVGLYQDDLVLDPCYVEDSQAILDANIVKNSQNQYIEVQISAERSAYSSSAITELLVLADKGIDELIKIQSNILRQIN